MTYTYSDELYSDLHKDAYGFRPSSDSYQWWASASDDEKQTEWDRLIDALDATVKREKEEQRLAVIAFEDLVRKTIHHGGVDRETALKWIMDASICDGDWEFLCFEHGLPYGYFSK